MGGPPLPALPYWRLLQNSQLLHGTCPKHAPHPGGGQPLMRTPEPWQPGQVGALELGSQVPVHTAPAASSLAPSEPVSAGPQHLGREVSDQGRPSLLSKIQLPPSAPSGTAGARDLRVQMGRTPLPPDPRGLVGRGRGTGSWFWWCSPCVHSTAGSATPPSRICLDLQEHGRSQALPHSGTAVAGFAPGQGGASQSPFRFLFLPMPLLEAWHRLPRGDMKEEGTQ